MRVGVTVVREQRQPQKVSKRRKVWTWLGAGLAVAAIALAIAFQIMIDRAEPILKNRVVKTLSSHFASRVDLDSLQVSIWHGLNVTGKGLRIFPRPDVMAAGAKAPLIAIEEFDFHAPIAGIFIKPMHIGAVHVRGLDVEIPPKEMRGKHSSLPRHFGKDDLEVDSIVCEDSRLVIGTTKPDKDPLLFKLQHIELHDVGPADPWDYDAILTNAVPRGNIHAVGTFGPWNTESPGDSNVTGKFIFDQADMNTIHGLGGMLHSNGRFSGQLDRIDIHGTADVDGFSLDTANHPLPLKTEYDATVDGTSGDTYLHSVKAQLASSHFSCAGAIVNEKGKGHSIDLDVDVPAGQLRDFLQLSVKTDPPIMSGVVRTKTRLHIPAGKESVSRKLTMSGGFTVRKIHFTNPTIQDKVDMMSLRASGDPKEANPGAPDVRSRMTGRFEMRNGKIRFSRLNYELPGATVKLAGIYTLDGKQLDFTGEVRTKAEISEMMKSKWKRILLKPIDLFFHKDGAGAQIPVKISGTGSKPHFGLRIGGK